MDCNLDTIFKRMADDVSALVDERFIELLSSADKHDFSLKGKRVNIEGQKINYSDFFKLDFSRGLLCVPKQYSGVDTLAFAIYGMCFNLISACDTFNVMFEKDDTLENDRFLNLLLKYINNKYLNTDLDLNELVCMRKKINSVSFINSSDSISSVVKAYNLEQFKSLYFAPYFGTCCLRPDCQLLDIVIPTLFTLALRSDADAVFTDIFCTFRNLIYLGGVCHINSLSLDDTPERYGSYNTQKGICVTDLESISRIISTLVIRPITSFRLLDTNDDNIFESLSFTLGNDFIADYLTGNDISKMFKLFERNKIIEIPMLEHVKNEEDKALALGIKYEDCWASCNCIKTMSMLGIDPLILPDTLGLIRFYLDYETWTNHMIRHYSGKMVRTIESKLADTEKDRDKKVRYYQSRNTELSKTIKSLKSDIKSLTLNVKDNDLSDECQDLERKLLESKNKVEILSIKINELENKLTSQNSDFEALLKSLEVVEEENSSGVSEADMLSFLNGFKICFVGGRYDMSDKLKELGLYNFVQAVSVNDATRLSDFDFLVSMTRFMSHNLFYVAMSKLGSTRDNHLYFNGTNLSNLITSCYEFITKYFEIS